MSTNIRRKRRQGRQQWKKNDSDYDSDDPRSYKNVKDPDPTSNEYFHDEVDEFHQQREKILLEVDQTVQRDKGSDNEEEVLGWEDDDSDEGLEKKAKEFEKHHHVDEMASDLEDDADDNEDRTDDRAWGQRKQLFHGADFVGDNVLDKLQEDEEEEQAAEEQEARLIQRRMAEALDEGDFNMDIIQTTQIDEEDTEILDETEDKVKQDLSKLSKQEKLQILKKESPELLELVEDCKAKLLEVKDRLEPLIQRVREGRLPPDTLGVTYIQTKYHLYLNYCLNINFYMVMKARHISVKNHPVIGRILSYRKLINELKPADDHISDEIEQLLANQGPDEVEEPDAVVTAKSREGGVETKKKRKKKSKMEDRKLSSLLDDDENKVGKKQKKRKSGENSLTEDELRALDYYKKMEVEQNEKKSLKRGLHQEEPDQDEVDELEDTEEFRGGEGDEDGKRAITYQISKNKGLTTRKKKELRNPRVKHRNKFRRAKIRRRGQVVEARTEMNRYGGELSGIRASVVKSVKLK